MFPTLFRGAGWRTALSTSLLAMACALAHAQVPRLTLEAPPEGRNFGNRSDQFGGAAFTEREFFISGQARRYKAEGNWGSDGKWAATLVSSDTPYKTAIIVRRPIHARDFNGVVQVEWLNVSTGYPLDVDWGMNHEEILRKGYAYVGVVTQRVGVTGVQKLDAFKPRYDSGSIPTDDISYDILSQVGRAVREQASVLLGGLQPRVVLASGHSQSAIRLTTYANAIQPMDQVFDGILIHGRANAGTKLRWTDNTPSQAFIRSDTRVPVFQIQSQMDVSVQAFTSKAMDTGKVRYWEVAGTAHADQYLLDNIYLVSDRDVGFDPPTCLKPHNAMPFYMAQNAALRHLARWAAGGEAPPVAPRLQRNWLGAIVKDVHGNAVGGLRLPDIEAPIATHGNSNLTAGSLEFLDLFACVAGGFSEPFDATKLRGLYPTRDAYFSRFKAAADQALQAGYLLPEDHARAVARARVAPVSY